VHPRIKQINYIFIFPNGLYVFQKYRILEDILSILFALLGVIIISIGGLLATRYWEGLSNYHGRKSLYSLLFIAFPLLLLGGYLSTYYWNKYFHEREVIATRLSLANILAAEILINKGILNDRKFTEPIDSNLKTLVVFPRQQLTVLQAVLASGAFSANEDAKLFRGLFDLNRILHEANHRIDITEKQMIAYPTSDNIYVWRKKVSESKVLKSAGLQLDFVLNLLSSDLGIDTSAVFSDSETARVAE